MAEELWLDAFPGLSMETEGWPKFDERLLKNETIEIIVQVNGKLRSKIVVPADQAEDTVRRAAITDVKVKQFLAGKQVRKTIFVSNKLINFVV
jgi:leucyl-tRNA synthetase